MLPDDIQALLYPVLAHRLILATYTSLRGKSVADVLAEVTAQTPVPVEESWSVEEPAQQQTGQRAARRVHVVTRWLTWLIALTVVLALVLRDPMLALVALLLALLGGLAALWDRYALAAMVYERKLSANRLFVGEETDLTIQITNAKPLPLAWLKIEDELPAEVTLARGRLHRSYKPNRRLLTNTLSLRFYERVRKQYHLQAAKRGAFTLGPVELAVGRPLWPAPPRTCARTARRACGLPTGGAGGGLRPFHCPPIRRTVRAAPACRRPAADRRHAPLCAGRQSPPSALEGDGAPRQPADQDV